MNNFQERIETTAQKILDAISPVCTELGLDDIENRTQVDILVLVHALRQAQDFYLDEISDGQFRLPREGGSERVHKSLPSEDEIKNQERVIFKKDGVEYIIYYHKQEGPWEETWDVFRALPEDQCGSDDDPDYSFKSYQELWEWAENAGGPNLS